MGDRGEVRIPIGPNYLVLYLKEKRVPVLGLTEQDLF